jgi:hypothetical protein
MTSNESFKKRVRARMARTGERYAAARRVLERQAAARGTRTWVSSPEHDDAAIRAATGRGWDAWCDLVDGAGVDTSDHGAIATFAYEEAARSGRPITHWWSQSVAVGYERITGLRLPYQRSDGTFTVSRSRTVPLGVDAVRALLLDESGYADLFPGLGAHLRSRPSTKVLRVGLDEGVVLVAADPAGDGRARVTMTHERLATPQAAEAWRHYWGEWLAAVADG